MFVKHGLVHLVLPILKGTYIMVHPQVQKFYKETGIEFYEKAEDKIDREFRAKTSTSKHSFTINSIYRSKKGGFRSQEYVWFFREDKSLDKHGNEIQLVEIIGKYDMPIAQYQYDEAKQSSSPTGVARFETVYEIPFTQKVIDDFIDNGQITGNTMFFLETPTRTYGDIDFEDFKAMPYESLVQMCRTGARPPPEQIQQASQSQQQKQQSTKRSSD